MIPGKIWHFAVVLAITRRGKMPYHFGYISRSAVAVRRRICNKIVIAVKWNGDDSHQIFSAPVVAADIRGLEDIHAE